MTSANVIGALVGLIGAGGALALYSLLHARRITLIQRVEPYIRPSLQAPNKSREHRIHTPLGVFAQALEPVVARLDTVLIFFSSPHDELRVRLQRGGSTQSVTEYRLRQLQFAVAGLLAAVAIVALLAFTRGASDAIYIMVLFALPLSALAQCDHLLKRSIARREARILAQFPTVAELLALAVSAGEGPMSALERVARSVRGELSDEISRVVNSVHAGAPLTYALESLGKTTQLGAIIRFADGVSVAVDRGSPLAEVLRAQAQDARGGKKEIAMLIPVVFLLLPITVVFAIFPSFSAFGTTW